MSTNEFILKWSIGYQDTTSLSDYERQKYLDMLWLCKLSIISFQKWFPKAEFILQFNGPNYEEFEDFISSISPQFLFSITFINQRDKLRKGDIENPYHFYPVGVWWKWLPFRFDIFKNEIAIDTDIICIAEPKSWFSWLDRDEPLLIAPERYMKTRVNTAGDFFSHPLIVGKPPFNCGIVGQKAGHNYDKEFFDITQDVKVGFTHDSLFITEQGAINLWIRSLEMKRIQCYCLPFEKNAWIRDFLYFLRKGISVETIHAVTWHKNIVIQLKDLFEARICNNEYLDNSSFISEIISQSAYLDNLSKLVLVRQIQEEHLDHEVLLGKS